MSSIAARLRGLMTPREGAAVVSPREPAAQAHARRSDAAQVLDGLWQDVAGRRFLVIDRAYTPGHRHGDVVIADALPPAGAPWPRLPLLSGGANRRIGSGTLLFLDLETTGLTGGAGTYAFLVGCAWFEPPSPLASAPRGDGTFRIRQFFLSDFDAERTLLDAVKEAASEAGAVVTYNGKAFDLPLIETRCVLHRKATPFDGVPHIDMLHPARRLWRGAEADVASASSSCRLSALERSICGYVREGDVPAFEIPSRYFHYVRTGDARPLAAVLDHNRLDLLSLALLTSRAARLLEDGPASARTAREAFGLGQLFLRGGMTREAGACFARAVDLTGDLTTHAEALRAHAVLSRRERRHEEAAGAWRRILRLKPCPPQIFREATEALAVHHEHRLRDPGTARAFALQSLPLQGSPTRRQAIHHRLARLSRKMGQTHASAEAALF